MATARSLCLRAAQMVGIVQDGGTLGTTQESTYLLVLNAMLDSWSIEQLLVYQLLQESLALTSSVGSYTIGTGAAFSTTRPTKIVDPCFIRDSADTDYPLEIIEAETYGRLPTKTVDGVTPEYLFYDTAFDSSGFGTIFLYPEPGASLTLYINSWKQLQQFALITTTVLLPPGYQRAIESNLAIELGAGKRTIPNEVLMIARDSKAALKRINSRSTTLKMPAGLVRTTRFSILTGV